MNPIAPIIKLHTSKDDTSTGIHINNLVIEYQGNYYSLQGGTNDTIHVFTESIALYVLSTNSGNGTMGLSAFMQPEPEPINSVFLHNNKEIREHLGSKWEGMKPVSIVKQLMNYLY